MSDNNNNSSCSCGCGCLEIIILAILICFMVSYCHRQDKGKSFLDNSIEEIKSVTNHVDSVWNYNDTTNH